MLLAPSGGVFGNPWAHDAVDVAENQLETALGSYVGAHRDGIERDIASGLLSGSLVLDKVSGVGVAGAGVYAHASGASWFRGRWGHLDLLLSLLDVGTKLVDFTAPSLAPCIRFSVLKSGVCWLLVKVALPCMSGLITSMW